MQRAGEASRRRRRDTQDVGVGVHAVDAILVGGQEVLEERLSIVEVAEVVVGHGRLHDYVAAVGELFVQLLQGHRTRGQGDTRRKAQPSPGMASGQRRVKLVHMQQVRKRCMVSFQWTGQRQRAGAASQVTALGSTVGRTGEPREGRADGKEGSGEGPGDGPLGKEEGEQRRKRN